MKKAPPPDLEQRIVAIRSEIAAIIDNRAKALAEESPGVRRLGAVWLGIKIILGK